MDERRAAPDEAIADLAVDADVGAAEAIDRLLRVADNEETAGNRRRGAPIRRGWIRGGEQHQDLRLQRVGVLELVDEDMCEAALKPASHQLVSPDQIAGLEQQIEEIERARARLERLVPLDRSAKLLLQRRGEIGVGVHPELIEVRLEPVQRVHDRRTRDALAIPGSAAVADP